MYSSTLTSVEALRKVEAAKTAEALANAKPIIHLSLKDRVSDFILANTTATGRKLNGTLLAVIMVLGVALGGINLATDIFAPEPTIQSTVLSDGTEVVEGSAVIGSVN